MTEESLDTDSKSRSLSDRTVSADADYLLGVIYNLHVAGEAYCTLGLRPDSKSAKAIRSIPGIVTLTITYPPEMVALAAATAIFSKAFLETVGSRAGDGIANLPKRLQDLLRTCHRRKKARYECHIGMQDRRAAATVVIKADLPDEARLALLDLDVTADELRGKLLMWDSTASAWRPAERPKREGAAPSFVS